MTVKELDDDIFKLFYKQTDNLQLSILKFDRFIQSQEELTIIQSAYYCAINPKEIKELLQKGKIKKINKHSSETFIRKRDLFMYIRNPLIRDSRLHVRCSFPCCIDRACIHCGVTSDVKNEEKLPICDWCSYFEKKGII